MNRPAPLTTREPDPRHGGESLQARRLLDNLTTAVLLFDGELRVRLMNAAAETLLSISRRQARGLTVDELLPSYPRFGVAVRRAMFRRTPFTERDMHLKIGDARFVVVDCAVTPLVEADAVAELLVELTDVDRHHRIVREASMLAQGNVAKALVRGLAHEIKNPLGGIRGAAQLLEEELPEEEMRDYTRIIIGEADRLRTLIDRLRAPREAPVNAAANIHEVLEHVRGLVAAEAAGGVHFEVDYDPSLPELLCDRDQLVQALLNVLGNAAQAAAPEGHVLIRTRAQRQLTIGTRRHRLAIRIDVVDDGPGVPAELTDSIFYPMVSGRAEGTGLGLPIAQNLVHGHGGLIEFESRPGETTFTIWLPMDDER